MTIFLPRSREIVTVPAAGIHGLGEPIHSTLLPVLQILLMPRLEVGMLHDDHCGGRERQIIVRAPARHQNAVADLEILQLDGRGVLQILFAGSDAQDASCGLHRDVDRRDRNPASA